MMSFIFSVHMKVLCIKNIKYLDNFLNLTCSSSVWGDCSPCGSSLWQRGRGELSVQDPCKSRSVRQGKHLNTFNIQMKKKWNAMKFFHCPFYTSRSKKPRCIVLLGMAILQLPEHSARRAAMSTQRTERARAHCWPHLLGVLWTLSSAWWSIRPI